MTPPSDPKPDPNSVDYAALAQRYMDLWQEQAAKMAQDPTLATSLAAAWGKMTPGSPFSGPFSNPAAPYAGFSTTGTAQDGTKTASPPPGHGGVDLAALLRRVDELERRLAALESAKSEPAAPKFPAKGTRRKPPAAE